MLLFISALFVNPKKQGNMFYLFSYKNESLVTFDHLRVQAKESVFTNFVINLYNICHIFVKIKS